MNEKEVEKEVCISSKMLFKENSDFINSELIKSKTRGRPQMTRYKASLGDDGWNIKDTVKESILISGFLKDDAIDVCIELNKLNNALEDLRTDNLRLNKQCDSFMKELGLNDDWG